VVERGKKVRSRRGGSILSETEVFRACFTPYFSASTDHKLTVFLRENEKRLVIHEKAERRRVLGI